MRAGFTTSLRRKHRWADARGFGSDNLLATRSLRVASPGKNHVYQTHFSALRGQAQAHARVPRSHEITRRPRRAQCTPRQGPQAPRGLNQGRPTVAYAFSRAYRLQSEAEFAAVAQAGPDSIRLSQRWFVLIAKPIVSGAGGAVAGPRRVRFGLTVGKRLARRAVDRVLIKRILREAARHSVPHLAAIAHADIDILLRLKAPPPPQDSTPRGQAKRALREDVDALLRRLQERLAEQAAADKTK
jgi:ribonuclease P protein component